MKIAASHLALQSNHAAFARHEREETLRAWRDERPDSEAPSAAVARISAAARQALAAARDAVPRAPTAGAVPPAPTAGAVPPAPTFRGESAPGGTSMFPPAPTSSASSSEAQAIDDAQAAADNDPFLAMIRQMIEFLTGEKVKVFDSSEFSTAMRRVEMRTSATSESLQAANNGRAGWGVEYDARSVREEFEQTSFSAQGTIRTADGREFSFRLDLEMTRYYREETQVSLRAGDAVKKDPLVVNFGGTAAELAKEADRRFRFDLDGDGRAETLPLFASGSGYLAIDWNGNGRIDTGRELFGPRTGQGFAELAHLDADGNGWIDEADPAFGKLLVWTPAATGAGELYSLAQLGVGALSLAHVATPFSLRGEGNRDQGQVRASGIYLAESGRAGSVQEIDLTI